MKYPWIAWYPAEYISKTRALTMKQHGAYSLLLWEYYINGPLVANAVALLNVCGARTEEDRQDVLTVLQTFFVLEDGFWHHFRADEEIKKRTSISEQRKLVGQKGGLAKARNLLQQTVKQKATQSQSHIRQESKGGEIILSSIKPNGKHPPPSKTYEQSDFDERDLRKLCAAEKEIMFRMAARIGCEPVTDQEFFTAACDEAGITVERGLKLKEMQRKWPEGAQ